MAKSQVKGSKKAKKKPPSQRGNGGQIVVFTHHCRWWLCHDSRTKRNSAAQCGTQKSRSEPCRPTTTQYGIWRYGTIEYAPPEMLTRDVEGIEELRHSETIDTYALCSIMHLLLTLETPYQLASRINDSPYLVKMKEEPKIIPNVPVCKLLKLADQGIKANQEKRFSIRELYKELCKLV